jgi:hypothetical protein
MKPVGIRFPTAAETARRNAGEYRGLSAPERLECLLALIGTVEAISRERPDRAAQLAGHDRLKDEELEILIRTQVRGHV